MARIDIGKGLKYALIGAAESAKNATESIKTAAQDVKLPDQNLKNVLQGAAESVKTATDSIKEAAQDVKLPDQIINIQDQVKDVFKKNEMADSSESEAKQKGDISTEKSDNLVVRAISTKNAIKIFYYMMSADGEIVQSEEEKFNSIGVELDPDFAQKKTQIISECREQIDKIIDEEDYYDVIQDGVEDAIISSMRTEDSFITPKLLVWDLLTLAYGDEHYDETERKLLKYIVRKLDIDKSEFLEMESSIETLMDLEKELMWIKTTDRPYLKIESMVNEIQDRKNVIFESVKDLISL